MRPEETRGREKGRLVGRTCGGTSAHRHEIIHDEGQAVGPPGSASIALPVPVLPDYHNLRRRHQLSTNSPTHLPANGDTQLDHISAERERHPRSSTSHLPHLTGLPAISACAHPHVHTCCAAAPKAQFNGRPMVPRVNRVRNMEVSVSLGVEGGR
ncbi:hypothetical protein DFP72DRAFT_917946 [Ephemerocybe angulata]|uniref:Uncharacterized protein n=1 Tax=Ephemerocybe angulata TaxID=980116 RepID=A0A8H6M1A8_9AGAR|nr:hypothetical protein DFP72DRAFT_917946 [Tulosesus angulatus]